MIYLGFVGVVLLYLAFGVVFASLIFEEPKSVWIGWRLGLILTWGIWAIPGGFIALLWFLWYCAREVF